MVEGTRRDGTGRGTKKSRSSPASSPREVGAPLARLRVLTAWPKLLLADASDCYKTAAVVFLIFSSLHKNINETKTLHIHSLSHFINEGWKGEMEGRQIRAGTL